MTSSELPGQEAAALQALQETLDRGAVFLVVKTPHPKAFK